jgi:hypothetical protein
MEVRTEAFKEPPRDLQYSILSSPWAKQVEQQIKDDVEATVKAQVVASVGQLCAERMSESRRVNQKNRDEALSKTRAELELDIATRVSATEDHWAGLLKAETDRNAQVSAERHKEIDTLKAEIQQLEDQRMAAQKAWDAEKASLQERREQAHRQREDAIRRIENERTLLRRKTTEVCVDCSCMGQTVVDHLESGWDGVSDQWGHQFQELLDIVKARLKPATSRSQLEAMQKMLIEEYSKLGHPGLEEKTESSQDLISSEASHPAPEGVRKAVHGLTANAIALARTHRRRKEQRTTRSERNNNSFDQSWHIGPHSDSTCDPVTLSKQEVLEARSGALKGIRFCCMPPHLGGPNQPSPQSGGTVLLPPLSPRMPVSPKEPKEFQWMNAHAPSSTW